MRILIVGSGGREHALVWKLSQEAEVFCTPGNAGISEDCATFDVPATDHDGIVALARSLNVDLVLIGPENPLIDGLADTLRGVGLPVFGPGSDGARHEASKAWSKAMMCGAGVPTATSGTFTEVETALEFARQRSDAGRQVVVKASGAALGKGVVVCSNLADVDGALRSILVGRELGEAGSTVVVEDRLLGREFSLLTLVSGRRFRSLPVAQDYKRIFDGDRGPNTGGMGSYSPVNWVESDFVNAAEERVVKPMVETMADQGIDYRGVLFSGLMVEGDTVFCLEYNVRFGDPEIQSVVRRLGTGFVEALKSAADGNFIPEVEVLDNAAVTVVLASGGYPSSSTNGAPISIGELPDGVKVFHSGTAQKEGAVVTNGGRVLCVSACANAVPEARSLAYAAVDSIHFDAAQFRTDIAKQTA